MMDNDAIVEEVGNYRSLLTDDGGFTNWHINKACKLARADEREKNRKILAKIGAKFGVREVLLALGDFKNVEIEEALEGKT